MTEPTQAERAHSACRHRAGSLAIPVLHPKLFARMTRSRCQTLLPCRVYFADRHRRSHPLARNAVTNQMSIGSEKVPISGDRARNGKFESNPLQR